MASPSALAQKSWKPDRQIEIVVGTDPGNGFRTARLLQRIWQSDHLVKWTRVAPALGPPTATGRLRTCGKLGP